MLDIIILKNSELFQVLHFNYTIIFKVKLINV